MTNNFNENEKYLLKAFKFGVTELEQPSEGINPKGWINYGYMNNYPKYLVELINKSARHSNILKTKANMIGGNGWMKSDLTTIGNNFLYNNGKVHLDTILARCSYDYVTYGAFALNPVWSKDRKSIAEINYISPYSLRVATHDPADLYKDERENYFTCDDWSNINHNAPIFHSGFSTKDRDVASQILYVKDIHGDYSNQFYGVPTYTGGINWMEIDYQLGTLTLSLLAQGFHPNMIINFPMEPSAEEADLVIRSLKREYEGAAGGKVLFTFSDGVDKAPKITPIEPNYTDAQFKDIDEMIEKNIYQAHQITNPALYGCFQTGKLDNTSNLVESLSIFQSMYFDQKQRAIQYEFQKLANINGIQDKFFIEKYNLKVTPVLKVQDIMMVLDSTISNTQKQAVFESIGMTREEAAKLCPNDAPIPTAPIKVSPTTVVPTP